MKFPDVLIRLANSLCIAAALVGLQSAEVLAQLPPPNSPPQFPIRTPPPTGTIAPPGFSVEIQNTPPSSASNAARAAGAQLEPGSSASFEPATARVGSLVDYSVRVFAAERVIVPGDFEKPEGLEMSFQGAVHRGVAGQLMSELRYTARPLQAGEFTIPSYRIQVGAKVVQVPQATLIVTEADPNAPAYQPVRAAIDLPKRDFYVGESVEGRVLFFETPDEQPQFIQHVVKSSGPVLFKPNTRPTSENVVWEGKPARALAMPVELTPLVAGEAEINCQVIVHVNRPKFGGRQFLTQSTVDVPSAQIRVLPLPAIRPAGFTGAVGKFTVAQPRLSATSVEVGEPIIMTVALTGEGNLDGVPPPELEASAEWTAYRPTSEVQRENGTGVGTKLFTFTLIPKQEGKRGTPAIPFAYFDPEKRAFVDVTIPPQPISIKASAIPVAATGSAGAPETTAPAEPPREAEPTLTGLAEQSGEWHSAPGPNLTRFLWLQLIPPLVLVGLFGWRRRVEYLERHPEVIRRRRARAAAKKALAVARAAARRGDSAGFLHASLGALRQAASPHDTAEAESLTREEVLRQLTADERASRAARLIFENADAARYASRPVEVPESTKLLPDLEHAVARLSSQA